MRGGEGRGQCEGGWLVVLVEAPKIGVIEAKAKVQREGRDGWGMRESVRVEKHTGEGRVYLVRISKVNQVWCWRNVTFQLAWSIMQWVCNQNCDCVLIMTGAELILRSADVAVSTSRSTRHLTADATSAGG